MKKILFLMAIFLSCLSSLTTLAQSKIIISPHASFVGITKNSNTYTKQSLKDNYSSFFVGLDNSKNISGRVYLEFDLGSIPKKADITSAILKLTTTGSDSNFNGSIIIKSSNILTNADESTWYSLKGLTGSPIISANFPNSGTSLNLTSDALKSLIKNSAGGLMCLSINNPDESKIIRFSGDILKLSLEVTHTGISTEGDGTTRDLRPLPSKIISGEEITLGYVNMPLVYEIKEWKYDQSQFTEVRRDKGTITLIPKPIIGSTRASVTMVTYFYEQFFYYHKYTHTWNFPIDGAPMIVRSTSEKVVYAGETVGYRIENFIGNLSDITWQSGDNMSLISASGEYATFKASGNGSGTVKAKVNDKGKVYDLQSSDVWIGTPKISITYAMDESSLNSTYVDVSRLLTFSEFTTLVIDGYGVDLSGNISNIEWQNNSGSPIFTTGNGVTSNPTADRIGSLGRVATFKSTPNTYNNIMFKIRAKNKCGWSYWKYISWSGSVIPGGYGVRSAALDDQIIEVMSEIKSVKIYNLSGVLVYSDNAVNGSFDIKSTVLTDGIYIIEKSDGQNRTSEKVMLKR
ncbi:putative secreted protein (Por secretion system target) [Dysgonomonas alginatilytica]|uniref:Putative secreted protein (Por secretion system target) n=1 Tax=Dysgonomonas alginatilytica TaxID=1605892 RepID=A0A2V3PW64_9BACT|nr:T9SS type A sorting domain-containing protein [Dysgonomonas alginatilytica]PXV69081.1 putative secreted protein (Por secretion system target) [Dysgonomonas alginatilytica]